MEFNFKEQYKSIGKTAKLLNIPDCFLRMMVKKNAVPGFYSGNRFYINFPEFELLIKDSDYMKICFNATSPVRVREAKV